MPKLPPTTASAVNNTEAATSFAPVPPGMYPALLRDVKIKDGNSGPYWVWEYEIPAGYEFAGRRFWNNTSLSEASRPFLKKAFDAFGVSADTNTDELCGQWVTLRIGTRVIRDGERAGEVANTVTEVLPYVDNGEGADVASDESF